eukprot:CAMPEP_0205938486 /NCGR_PEP_ID=MMETSP1325-20131115/47135_1 /ASSEMBLY_ACC=CAM_ASM_000708 /TAXON_ID=236786 /ORGANISM="Florenciella sp., Strain RCC1007" /LENGTH=54 /DNA_ID=CAMNT_0053308831 /DNA_START=292 /DNA_END=453 /DNA_ORIENTATION=-
MTSQVAQRRRRTAIGVVEAINQQSHCIGGITVRHVQRARRALNREAHRDQAHDI